MKIRILIYFLLLPFLIHAQLPKHRVKYKSSKTWMRVTTEHFDLAYYNDNKDFAVKTSKYLELAWREVCKDLDFEPKERYLVHLYPSVFDYAQDYENHFPTFYKNLNYFYLHKSVFSLYYNGTQKDFYKQIKTQLCKALLSEMFYKSRASSALQTNLLVYLPDWYITGLSAFIGEGWDANDEAILRGFSSKLVENGNQGFEMANHEVLKKSIWLFVANEYRTEKIAEILYMSRLTRTADGGFVTVLGTSMYRFSQNWVNFVKNRAQKAKNTNFLTYKNHEILQASPKNDKIAHISYKNGKLFLSVLSSNLQVLYHKYLSGYSSDEFWIKSFPKPLCWSNDGSKVAVVLPRKGKAILFIWEEKSGELTEYSLENSFDFVHSMSFTSTGKLLMSACKNGQTDLFLLALGQDKASQLTKTWYDEIFPYELNSKYYYSAAYPIISGQFQPDSLEPEWIKNYYSVFSLDPENKAIALESQEFQANLFPQIIHDELCILSDKSGTLQLKDTSTISFQSSKGLTGFQADKNNYLFAQYQNGIKKWIISKTNVDSIIYYENKNSIEYLFENKIRFKEIKRVADSLEQVRIENVKLQDSLNIENQDSNKTGKVRYYVFDDEDSVKTVQKTPKKKKKNRLHERVKIPDFDIKQVKITGFENDTWTPLLLKVGTFFVLDPLFRLGLKNELQISDVTNANKFKLGFTPYMDFRSSDMYLDWQHKKHLLHYGVEMKKSSRYFKKPQRIRYNVVSAKANVGLTLNIFEQINFSSQTSYIKRTDLALTDLRVLDGKEITQEFSIQYHLNKVKRFENYNRSGHSLQMSLSSHGLIRKIGNPLFYRLEADARKYFHIGSGITFATRFSAGVNFGPQRPKYFIGGVDNWINSDIENRNNFPIEGNVQDFYFSKITLPMRGFSYNARNGTQYGIINTELRIPFGSLAHLQLRSRSLYNFRWIIFADMGTSWTTGNPFSQKNPIDAETLIKPPLTITVQSLKSPFIFGIGTGLQFYLSGYPIRIDVAFPIEDRTFTKTKIGFSIGYEF